MNKFWIFAVLALILVLASACTPSGVNETKTSTANSPVASTTVAPTITPAPSAIPTQDAGSYSIRLPEMYVQGFQTHWMNVLVGDEKIEGGIAFVFDIEVKVDANLNPVETSILLQEIWATDTSQFHPSMGLVTIEVFQDMPLVGEGSRVEFSDGTILTIPEITLPAGTHSFSTGLIWVYPMDAQGIPLKTDPRAFQA